MSRGSTLLHGNSWGAAFFAIALSVGAAAIFLMKGIGLHQIVVTAVPCLLMLGYAGVALIFRGVRLRIDQTADNCYYLGFIFTLISLAISLYEISDQNADVRSIITNFGIAIFSTIVGLGLRVALSQMRQDPYEIEHQTRTELATSARRLRVQLDQSISEFSLFGRELRQVHSEGMEETRQSIDKLLENGMTRFTAGIEEMTSSIEKSNEGFDARSQVMLDSSDKLVASISSLGKRIDSVKVSEDALNEQLGPAVSNLSKAADQIANATESAAASINKIDFPAEVINNGLVDAVSSLKEASETLKQAAATETGKTDEWKRSIDSLVAVSASLKSDLSGIDQAVTGLQKTVTNISTGSNALDQLPKSIDAFQQKLDALLALLQQSVDQQATLVQKLQTLVRTASSGQSGTYQRIKALFGSDRDTH